MSILLFAKNRGTNAFQIIMGLFLGISGATKRVLSVCNHMGICVSYEWVSMYMNGDASPLTVVGQLCGVRTGSAYKKFKSPCEKVCQIWDTSMVPRL